MIDLGLRPDRCALLVIDVQERLAMAMPVDVRDRLERNLISLAAVAGRFDLPVVVSEQYPKGWPDHAGRGASALER